MLNERQKQAFEFIRTYIYEKNQAPTVSEIASAIQTSSKGFAHRIVSALVNEGLIQLNSKASRNIELINDFVTEGCLPILGKIAAGSPIEAIEDNQTLSINDKLLGPDRFILQVQGDSMIGDNICDGDYIICEKRQTARRNEIVVALVDGEEATLKRLYNNQDGTVTLLPSNPRLTPMVYTANRIQVQGIYLGLLRFNY